MNDLLQKLDIWLKPINEGVFANLQAKQLVRYVAILMLVGGVLSLCGGFGLITAGGLAALGGTVGGEIAQQTQEGRESVQALSQVSGGAILYGILTLVTAPLLIIGAVGVFQRMSWGRMAAVLALVINAVINLLGIFMGGGIFFNVVSTLLYAYLAYLFYHHSAIKQEFGVQ